ncbi:uncharacterized protein LOC124375500 isoform X2 [Silurus meridionalis]|uniref:uncharacterized protein LOC124375500 isoform X2 n=1 Tax=Silurus meridionalis TaxID=175797 RepID=UPI001EEA3203|nr:uncharacterized protein LOC124375500 isoform X2 [Silurus meridionalis]
MMACWFDSYYVTIFLLMVTTAEHEPCRKLKSVEALLNSVVTLKCPLTPGFTDVTWEVLEGESAEKVVSGKNCSYSCNIDGNNNKDQKPLCKMRTVSDIQKGTGSLIISHVKNTDGVWYRCSVKNTTWSKCFEVKITVKEEPQLHSEITECKTIGPFKAVLNSTFMLQCPLAKSPLDEVIWGSIEGLTVPITRCTSSGACISSGSQKPLCERAKTMKNGSLVISPVDSTDFHWFLCANANSTLCYQFKLTAEGEGNSATQSPQMQTKNYTKVTITSATFILLFVAMLVGVCMWIRKQKMKRTQEAQTAAYNVGHAAGMSVSLALWDAPLSLVVDEVKPHF